MADHFLNEKGKICFLQYKPLEEEYLKKKSISLLLIIEQDRRSLIYTIILEIDKHILHHGPLVGSRTH
jgi:hypothetical protein